jgi:hypothetical protein
VQAPESKAGFEQSVRAVAERGRGLESIFNLKGQFHIEVWRKGVLVHNEPIVLNGVTDEGKDKALDLLFNDATSKIQDWAIGMINASGYTGVAAGDTMASHSGWTEWTSYDEVTRPEWDPGTASSQSITNATLRDFTQNATGTLKGVFICSDDTKGGTSGTLWATALFSGDISVVSSDVIKIGYTVSVS